MGGAANRVSSRAVRYHLRFAYYDTVTWVLTKLCSVVRSTTDRKGSSLNRGSRKHAMSSNFAVSGSW